MDWFLYDRDHPHEKVNLARFIHILNILIIVCK